MDGTNDKSKVDGHSLMTMFGVGEFFTKILAERTRQFSKELNKSLNDEGTLDELLDAVIMAEQDVMVSSKNRFDLIFGMITL